MKKLLTLLVLMLLRCGWSYAQTIDEVLHQGIPIKEPGLLILRVSGQEQPSFSYYIKITPNESYQLLDDSVTLFLPQQKTTNIYTRPINPLNFSLKTKVEFITDQIDEQAKKVLNSLASTLNERIGSGSSFKSGNSGKKSKSYNDLQNDQSLLEEALKNDYKKEINQIFRSLKAITFASQKSTVDTLDKKGKEIEELQRTMVRINDQLVSFKQDIANIAIDKNETDKFTAQQILSKIADDLSEIQKKHLARLALLKAAYNMLNQLKDRALEQDNHGNINWVVQLQDLTLQSGKVGVLSVSLYRSGYEIKDDEIVKSDEKLVTTKVLKFRRFQRILIEPSVGVAFTFLKFPKFSTTTDSTGQQYVADAGEDVFRKVNFTTMANFVWYHTGQSLYPFLQVGAGANAGYPTLFLGTGFKVSSEKKSLFAVSFGYASTWVKTLNKLKIGDKVAGVADVEKDITYEFQLPLKFYLGLQVNL